MVDGTVRVVLNGADPDLPFTFPRDDSDAARRDATAANQQVVRDSVITDWLPTYERRATGATADAGLAVACDAVHRPPVFAGFGTMAVLTLDLRGALRPTSAAGVLAPGETVYASKAGLYTTTQVWGQWEPALADDPLTTWIHAFDISDPTATGYRGSGHVDGYVLNQFSLSEHDGHLRVATTNQPPWRGGEGPDASHSAVTVLATGGRDLRQTGRVDGLGPGERIYAVRYLGDLAAVVTFREVDPLYLLDLSDPTAPRVRGELKIPGFSSYLHPVADGRLLGIGQDADATGRPLGVQASLFDISDLARPTRLAQVRFGQGHSEVEHDHRAFLHWAPTGLAVLPLQEWDERDAGFSGAVGLRVGSTDLQEAGRLRHAGSESWDPAIRRSFVVGDVLYTVSDQGLKASDLHSLADRGWAPFPGLR
jgi:hypothetical protein